ncbi:MAG: peptidase [Oscillochloridaceae bacterium umkhey_bin13]
MRLVRPLTALILLALLLTPLAAYPTPGVALAALNTQEVDPAQTRTALTPYIEQEVFGATQNDTPETAERIGNPVELRWTQTVSGTIGRSNDLDFYQFELTRPASRVQIRLSNLPADYDLILGGGVKRENGTFVPPPGFEEGLPGLEGITAIGGSIRSIGGSIRSIGGSIRSIGGSIRSIGGSIRSIGGSIRSISAAPGTADEEIDSFLWQPGIYFVAVGAANGQLSEQPYQIDLIVDGGALTMPQPSPEVEVTLALPWYAETPDDITTLYIYHPGRLESVYGEMGQMQVYTITDVLMSLTGAYEFAPYPMNLPPEFGVILDLSQLTPVISGTQTITDVYDLWDRNPSNPFYANYVAGLIRNVIKAATAPEPGASGPNPAFRLDTTFEGAGVTFPKVRNIVLIGGDNILPFFRLPDLTEIANEADYLAYTRSIYNQHMIDPDSALAAALRYRMLLSDNPYGTEQPYNFYGAPLYLPQLAVGRIVEDPLQIATYLRTYQNGSTSDFQIDATSYYGGGEPQTAEEVRLEQEFFEPTRAFVSGYDFLIDQADAVIEVLQRTGLTPDDLTVLNNDRWGRSDVERDWFDGRLSEFDTPIPITRTQIGLNSVNAHFDHWQLIPASEREGTFPALRLLSPEYDEFFWSQYYFGQVPTYFRTTLGYSVGCHSGYNMIDSSIILTSTREINPANYQADFPQAFNAHGGNWIGNTGYGYGTADGVDYSERLAVLLTEELARVERGFDGLSAYSSVGDALVLAKQRYVRNATSLSEYDYKTLSIMTLYGLPYMRVAFTNQLPPPPEDPQLDGSVPVESPAPIGIGTNGRGQLTREISFTLAISNSDFVLVDRTGSSILKLSPDNFTINDQFVDDSSIGGARVAESSPFSQTVRIFENNQVGVPKLPTFAYDISALASDGVTPLRVRDVVFLGGVYGESEDFNPQITQIVTETNTPIISTTTEPDFTAGAGIWFPDKFFSHSRVGVGELQRDQLVVSAAQFKADENGVTGTLRPYTELSFRVLYEDPNEAPAELQADQTAPVIESVSISEVVTPTLAVANTTPRSLVEVLVSDDGPVLDGSSLSEVSLVYIEDGTRWIERQLTEQEPGRYTVELPLAAGDVRVIVRATDHAGNSSYFTAKGSFRPAQPEVQPDLRIWLPLIRR